MDKNLTDNEIKKALEWYVSKFKTVGFVYMDADGTHLIGTQDVLDLINRLQAENERLSKITQPLIAEIKAEAYKEFAERLEEKSFQSFGNYGITRDVVEVCDIDNLLKEMESENNVD